MLQPCELCCSTASFAALTIFVLLAVLGRKRLHKFAVGHLQHINLHCEVLNGLLEMLLFPGVIVLKLLIHLLEPFYKVLFNFETQNNYFILQFVEDKIKVFPCWGDGSLFKSFL